MGYHLVSCVLFLAFALAQSRADVSTLRDLNQDSLDPVQNPDQDLDPNNQDKRTICAALNQCWSSPPKYTRPQFVLRPVKVGLGGYRYLKPKIPFRLKLPSVTHGGWKPVHSATKPVVEVHKPDHHVDIIHQNPPVHHVQPTVINLRPVARPPPAHVDQIHQITVPHGGHYDTLTHVDHLVPVAPVAPPPAVVKPFVPSPVLFEVTRPNLGVLPYGAKFLTSVLKEVPHVHVAPAPVAIPAPAAVPVPVAPAPAVPAAPAIPVGFPHIASHPGVSFEYHGTRNYLPLGGVLHSQVAYPHLHQAPTHVHHGVLPHEHPTQFLAPEQQLPHAHLQQQQLIQAHLQHQQELPHAHLQQQQLLRAHLQQQQELPHAHLQQEHAQLIQQQHEHYHQQLQGLQQYQEIPQGQLPLEGEYLQQQHQQQQGNQQGLDLQQFEQQSNVIQPGQTDVQIPYHFPQQGGDWNGGLQEGGVVGYENEAFRPSQQLEAPYKK